MLYGLAYDEERDLMVGGLPFPGDRLDERGPAGTGLHGRGGGAGMAGSGGCSTGPRRVEGGCLHAEGPRHGSGGCHG